MVEKNSQRGVLRVLLRLKSATFQILDILAWFSSSKNEFQHDISFKTVMDLKSFTTEQLSSFQLTTPPDKLFKDKRVEFFLVCIGTSKEVDQVFVCGEDQAFFKSDCDL